MILGAVIIAALVALIVFLGHKQSDLSLSPFAKDTALRAFCIVLMILLIPFTIMVFLYFFVSVSLVNTILGFLMFWK